MLVACITERAGRLEVPADLAVACRRQILEQLVSSLGAQLVREITDPMVERRLPVSCRGARLHA